MPDQTPGTAPVTDRRTAPRGVLPRGAQTWLMAGLALGILAIIVLTGQPEPATRQATGASSQALSPSPDRLRDYQDRLQMLNQRMGQRPPDVDKATPAPLLYEQAPAAAPDPLQAERKRREYESLFAPNLVLSRRPDAPAAQTTDSTDPTVPEHAAVAGRLAAPTLDEVAEAVVRATERYANSGEPMPEASPSRSAEPSRSRATEATRAPGRPAATGPIRAGGLLHRLLEGTVIDAVLTNRLDGSSAAPVNCLVTNPVYSHSGQDVLIPAGARVLGETKPVQALGETRLVVIFHRLLMPDGRTYGLNQFTGLNQAGDAGLRGQVNHHYLSTFGASAAVGLITGLSQFLGTIGFGGGDGDRTSVIVGGVGDATSQATTQVMNRFLNRLPTITIREGHRVQIYVTTDLDLPAYEPRITGDSRP